MTSPFRFDGTGEPETEEERRKRQLREAMRAAQLGLPLASQLPAMTITAPRPAALDASARRAADIVSAFESALETQRRLPEALKAAEAGIPLASRTQAPLPPVVITPENRYRAHPWTLAMNRAQMEQEEAAKLPELPKQLTMGDIAKDVAIQPLAAMKGFQTRFGEGGARLVGAERFADKLVRQREAVNEATQPTTSFGTGARILSELGFGAAPYVAAGGGLRGVGTSAALTGIESQSDDGSMVKTIADLTGSETLKRIAESPVARTLTDVGTDVGLNVLFGGRGQLADELSRIRQVSRRVPRKAGERVLLSSVARTATGGIVGTAVGDTPEERAALALVGATGAAVAPAVIRRLVRPATVPITDEITKKLLAVWERANPKVEALAEEFMGGTVPRPLARATAPDKPFAKRIADWYDTVESNPNDPAVQKAYRAFADETRQQYEFLRSKGIQFEFVDTDPYKTSAEMMQDVAENNRLKVLKTESGMHPLLTEEENDMFRAVHDFFGHAKEGHQFGQLGEENAYRVHSAMYSPEARRVMATETRGQNSWVNSQPANKVKPGSVYAEQKVALMPEEFMGEYPIERVTPEVVTNVEMQSLEMPGLTDTEVKKLGTVNRVLGREAFIRKVVEPIVKSEGLPVTVARGLGSWISNAEGAADIAEAARLTFDKMSPMAIQRVLARVSQAAKQMGLFFAVPNPAGQSVSVTLDFGKALREPEYRAAIERLTAADRGQLFEGTTMVKLDPAKVQIVLKDGVDEAGAESLLNLARQALPQYNTKGTVQRVEAIRSANAKQLNEAFADYFSRIGYLTPEQAQAQQRAITSYEQLAQAGPIRRALAAGPAGIAEGIRSLIDGGVRRVAEATPGYPPLAAGRGGVGDVGAGAEAVGRGGAEPLAREMGGREAGQGVSGKVFDVTGAVPEALRQTLASPVTSTAVGTLTGAAVDEEDRFRGAFVGAMGGATLAAGVRGTKNYLRNRAALKASGLSPDLADAYTIAKGGIDFTGTEAQRIQRGQRGPFRVQVENVFNNLTDVGRIIDVLAGKAEALGMPPEASVGTAYDIALGSDITAARALRHGFNLPGLKLVEKGGIVSPLTREIIGEPLEDVFKPLGGNVAKNEQGMTYLVALRNIGRYDAAATQARQFDELAAQATANADAARVGRPAAGVDDPALAQRLQEQGIRQATEAVGSRQDPLRVYGGNAERMAADRQIVEQFGQKPEFVEFANRMEQYFDNLTRYAVESGLWTAEQAARIRKSDAFYIPFKRLIEAYTGGGVPMRGRVTPGQVNAGVKRFTGSDLIIGNPAEAIAEYTAALIRRSDMYRVSETLIDTAERMGAEYAGLVTKLDANDPRVRALNVAQAEAAYRQLGMSEEDAQQMANLFLRMDDKNPVIFKNTPQGRQYYLLNEPQVFRALQVLNPQDGAAVQAILTVFGPLKNITTAFATQFSPGFWLGTNVPRDVVTGASYNRVTLGDVGFGFKEAIKSLAGLSEFAEQISRAGMGQVSQYGGTINPEAIARQIAPTTAGEALRADIRKFAGAPMRTLERVGRVTELPMRLAAARAAQRKAAEAGITPRGQMAFASRAGARATVDFRRRSGYALDRLAEGIIPYYGAGKKGLARAIQGAMENPKRIQAAAGLLTLATVFEYLLSRGEERQEFVDRPAGERARYLHYGNTRVALPQEFAVIAAATRLGLAQLEKDDPFAFEQFKQSIFNVLPPVATDVAKGDIAAAVAPMPIARQAVELSRNRSAFLDRPIVSQSMMRRLPEARRYETTAPTYDVLARGARAIGLEEASPIQAEYAMRGIFGRFAPAVTGITDIAAVPLAQKQAAERVPLPLSRQPLNPVTGFTARPVTRGQSEQEYYDIRSEVQQAKATMSALGTARKEAKERGDQQAVEENTAQVKQLVEENPTFAAVFADRKDKRIDKILSSLDDKLEKYDARRDAITTQFRNKKITGQRARQLLDENDKKRAELFRRGFEVLNERVPR